MTSNLFIYLYNDDDDDDFLSGSYLVVLGPRLRGLNNLGNHVNSFPGPGPSYFDDLRYSSEGAISLLYILGKLKNNF